jgi:hypothetical protein
MDWQTIGLAARHALTTVGGWLAAHGYLASDGITGFVGAGMVLAGIAASWWQKRGQAATVAELARLKALLVARSVNPAANPAKS